MAPLDELGVPTGVAEFVADAGFESRPAGLADPDKSGAVIFAGVVGLGGSVVSLKLILNAPLPQSISPPVKMNDKVLEGVELQ